MLKHSNILTRTVGGDVGVEAQSQSDSYGME